MATTTTAKPFETETDARPLIHHIVLPLNYSNDGANPVTNKQAEEMLTSWLRRGYVLFDVRYAADIPSPSNPNEVSYSRVVYTLVDREYVA